MICAASGCDRPGVARFTVTGLTTLDGGIVAERAIVLCDAHWAIVSAPLPVVLVPTDHDERDG